ncbi:P-loop containing nucleoside triphosphate hydrolase protein [Hesseltinella vesiculosa]|uniref:P-loop containing nucleoside triphosphate hydrolase protein n=1 Tax=Hesseltinella vesiculosa TaxID=101127 RepID=A0A1X2G6P9_9FUNG|nr:P-loop containing nucleoside triphosphate hydrolase protein [Hesseltinella vesiculosa]
MVTMFKQNQLHHFETAVSPVLRKKQQPGMQAKRLHLDNEALSTSSPHSSRHYASSRSKYRLCQALSLVTFMLVLLLIYIVHTTPLSIFQADGGKTSLASLVSKRTLQRWHGYLSSRFFDATASPPKLYYPPHCPSPSDRQESITCAKPVPSFIFAGSEMSGSRYIFEQLQHHPQVAWTMDASASPHVTSLDDDLFDDQKNGKDAFETYLSQFPFLTDRELANIEKQQVIVGEHAPHYLYKSFVTARRIKEMLPHVKLVFILRDPIDRAYTQFIREMSILRRKQQQQHHEQPNADSPSLSFEDLIDLEMTILEHCRASGAHNDWESFLRCHRSSDIRASWNLTITDQQDHHLEIYDGLVKGMYYNSLVPFLQHFGPSQLYVTRTEDFINNPSMSFQRLAKFLGIQEDYFSELNFYGRLALAQQQETPLSEEADDLIHMILQQQHYHHQKQQHQQQQTHRNRHSSNTRHRPQQRVPAMALEEEATMPAASSTSNAAPSSSPLLPSINKDDDQDALDLSIRYRLEKIFRPLNEQLLSLFEDHKDFLGWDYDVDRG